MKPYWTTELLLRLGKTPGNRASWLAVGESWQRVEALVYAGAIELDIRAIDMDRDS
jgi:hypothetical protein